MFLERLYTQNVFKKETTKTQNPNQLPELSKNSEKLKSARIWKFEILGENKQERILGKKN